MTASAPGYQARRLGDDLYEYRGYRIERTSPGEPVYPWLVTLPDGSSADLPRLRDAKRFVDLDITERGGDPVRFRPHQDVVISYPNPSAVGVARRRGWVVEDNGGPKVKVVWHGDDIKIPGRRYVLRHGYEHQQWIPRERLSA